MDFLILVLAVAALILAIRNSSRIGQLERREPVRHDETERKSVAQASSKSGTVSALRFQNPEQGVHRTRALQNEPIKENSFVSWIKENTLMKIGAFFIILAIIWFARYAFENQWIGEFGRIALGLIVSAMFMFYGFYDSFKAKSRGAVLMVVGMVGVLSTTYFARELYAMFTPASALAFMFIAVVFNSFASYYFNNRNLALATLILASFAPFLTKSANPDFYGLFYYLAVLVLGSLWLLYLKKWHSLLLTSFFISSFYSLVAFGEFSIHQNETLFAYFFAAIFYISSLVALIKHADDKSTRSKYLFLSVLSVFFVLFWTLAGMPKEVYSYTLLFWAVVFLTGSFASYVLYKKESPFIMYGAAAVLFFIIITAIELEFQLWLLAFSAEAMILTLAGAFLTRSAEISAKIATVFALPTLIAMNYALIILGKSHAGTDIFSDMYISMYIFTFVNVVTPFMLASHFKEEAEYKKIKNVNSALIISASLSVALFIWSIPHSLFAYDLATLLSLSIYTVIGLILYFNNFSRRKVFFHKLGIVVLVSVIIRLMLVEFWKLETLPRVIIAVLVGLALVSTAYMRSHNNQNKEYEKNQ